MRSPVVLVLSCTLRVIVDLGLGERAMHGMHAGLGRAKNNVPWIGDEAVGRLRR